MCVSVEPTVCGDVRPSTPPHVMLCYIIHHWRSARNGERKYPGPRGAIVVLLVEKGRK